MDPLPVDAIHNLPPFIDLLTAARALGGGRTRAYQLVRTGRFPCPIHRAGRLYKVRTHDILLHLGTTTTATSVTSR
jgi:hypothetical protein